MLTHFQFEVFIMKKKYDSDFHTNIISRLLLIIVLGLLASSAAFGQTATINDPGLNETDLDAQAVTITLTAETFLDATLDATNFTLNNNPVGLTIESVVYQSTTSADVNLAFTPGDFDVSITNFSISIDNSELTVTGSGVLTTNAINISADFESATMLDPSLNEGTLDNQSVIIDLTNETYDASLDAGNFTLVGFPPGLSIESVTRNNSMRATVNLAFDGTDFDTPYTNFYITIAAADLVQTSSGVLTPGNRLTITATVENPTANLTTATALREYNLDGSILNITLGGGESFINPGSLVAGNFVPENAPPGLSVGSISNPSSTSVDLTLDFTGTDFDVDYNDFRILINAVVLDQSDQNLATNSVPITHELEPEITFISIPNDIMGIDDIVPVTITVVDDGGVTFTLAPGGAIGGYSLGPVTPVDATTYTSSFTINEGGNSYAASQSIPVTDVQLMNGTIEGNIYSGFIVQDSDLLDASAPAIQYIYSSTGGAQNIGDEIFLILQATEGRLSFTPASHVNNVPVSSPNIEITENPLNRYHVRYVVAEGDDNVNPGEITLSMTAVDMAGNSSPPFTSIDVNTISIDANRPVITSAYISSTDEDVIVGETVEIVVNSDQTGYRNLMSDTWINGIYVDPPGTDPPHLTFTDLENNSYLYTYTVHENDGAVNRGELTINIVLQDPPPFSNTNFPWADLNENNVQIVTNRPSASISGTTEICYGDSAMLTVILGGTSPWTIYIFDGTTITQHTSAESPYTFPVYPEVSTIYTVYRVEDGTGNYNDEGAGEASITVHPLPDVQITNLDDLYDIESTPEVLTYTPQGGIFTGPGISEEPPWIFDPGEAGESLEGFPHQIEYTVTDANGCINSDLREVTVVSGSSVIDFEKPNACFNDASFLITGSNVAGSIGTFSVEPALPTSVFEDQLDNTAILRPDMYVIIQNLDLTIYYTYEDLSGIDIITDKSLTIEYLDAADINEPPDVFPCQNDNLIPLTGNYVIDFTFTGNGVVDTLGGYYFDPTLADTGSNLVVYEYTSAMQCQVSDSLELIVRDAPDAGFIVAEPCIPLGGGTVAFQSRSDAGTSVSWLWNFGDPESGFNNNRSIYENPTHHYDDTGSYTVSLSVSNGDCDDMAEKTIDIHPSPEADFSWNSNCLTDAPVVMTGMETVISPDTVSSWSWKIDSAGTEIISSDTSGGQFSYAFQYEGTYNVRYKVLTSALCPDSIDRPITLSPTYLLSPDSPYSEDFELEEEHGWVSDILNLNQPQNSWTDAVVSSNEFPTDAASGTRAWYTDRPDVATRENSYVLSPCFNFDTLYRPMVSLDIKRSLEWEKDGAALQYTTDNELNWHNVGGVDDGGLEWYNSTNMVPFIGNSKTGWTGGQIPSEDGQWYEAAHDLDKLAGKPEVRFRVAYGAWDHARTEKNDGFAFDNFTIRQRTRLSVLEYFTNANTALCGETDTTIMEIMNEVQADVIDIQYHAAGNQADEFNNDNPVPANSRGTFYGVSGIPYAILDGNVMAYDFLSPGTYPNVEDIRMRSLMDPDFKLTITVTQYTPTLEFSVEMEALRNLERKDRTLYAIVLERRVDDPEYKGTNGITVFRHVARRILPDAGGYIIGSNWDKGDPKEVELTYPTPFFPTDKGSITIAVFMQDDETLEILQAATNPEYVTSTFDELEPPSQVLIYPNPARELVNIYFEESPREEMRFTLYDLSGKMVITDVIEPWQQQFTRTLGDLEQGIYIVEIRTRDRKRVIYRDKLLHY